MDPTHEREENLARLLVLTAPSYYSFIRTCPLPKCVLEDWSGLEELYDVDPDFDRKPIRVNDKMNVDIEVDDTEDDILGVLRKAAGIQKDTEIQVSIAGKLVRKITYDKMEPNANYDVAAIQSQTSSEVRGVIRAIITISIIITVI
eukprot:2668360-Amphidinium_carterae.1